ncbi:MAG: hypothetical protein V7K72_17055 [Nostoc sp.]|uniref:hypothetical protein n=1 Tax=Nostoc sp. TaxID=1180 RepID=UPI002FFBAABE
MFICRIELLSLLQEKEPAYYIIGTYDFDPELKIAEEVEVVWQLNKNYKFKVKVLNREKTIYPKGNYPGHKDQDVFLLKIIVESEDRDKIIEIRDFMEKKLA